MRRHTFIYRITVDADLSFHEAEAAILGELRRAFVRGRHHAIVSPDHSGRPIHVTDVSVHIPEPPDYQAQQDDWEATQYDEYFGANRKIDHTLLDDDDDDDLV